MLPAEFKTLVISLTTVAALAGVAGVEFVEDMILFSFLGLWLPAAYCVAAMIDCTRLTMFVACSSSVCTATLSAAEFVAAELVA